MSNYIHQDWKTVDIGNRNYYNIDKTIALKKAQRSGQSMSIEKNKYKRSNNLIMSTSTNHIKKIEEETEIFHIQKSGLTLANSIQQARTSMNLTQKELATKLNIKPQIIQSYESGQAQPNVNLINKMEKIFKIKLPRPKQDKK